MVCNIWIFAHCLYFSWNYNIISIIYQHTSKDTLKGTIFLLYQMQMWLLKHVIVGLRSGHSWKSNFVKTVTPQILDGFQYKYAKLFSIMSRCAIWNICSGRPKVKVKVMRAQHVVPEQPSCLFCQGQTLTFDAHLIGNQEMLQIWTSFKFCCVING